MTGFHHTGALEVFYSLLLKYCPKRQHFSYIGMQAHIELAILNHNYNTNRKQATTETGILNILIKCLSARDITPQRLHTVIWKLSFMFSNINKR